MFYNNGIVNLILTLGGHTTKILDKGAIELLGPVGLEKTLIRLSKKIHALSTGIVTTYALFILIGFILYILAFSLYELANVILFIAILISFIFATSSSTSFSRNAFVPVKPSASQPQPHIILYSSNFSSVHISRYKAASIAYSTSTDTPPSKLGCFPVKTYENADLDKLHIIKDNTGKSGIYRWINQINGKTYIGSSIDLRKRLRNYFSFDYLNYYKVKNMLISKALLKYGYSKFKLEILEYCIIKKCIEREQYYLDHFQPEYNILKIAGSTLGRKHSEETIAKMKNRIWTEEQKIKNIKRLNLLNASEKHLEHLKNLTAKQSHSVLVLDTLTNEKTIYPSISSAAKGIGVSQSGICLGFKSKGESSILVKKKRYQITKLPK